MSRSIIKNEIKNEIPQQENISSKNSNDLNVVSNINESKIKFIKDYKKSEAKNLITNKINKLKFPKSNVLEFEAENGYKLIFRPSGTEPKIKMYISVNTKLEIKQDFEKTAMFLENEINNIVNEINL